MTPELHIMGIDPGGTTGWCRITIPRTCMFGQDDAEIIEWDYGVFTGDECMQAISIARLAREIQSLTYKVGPALIVEDWDSDPSFRSADKEAFSPLRIGAYLRMLDFQTGMIDQGVASVGISWLADATLNFQSRVQAKQTATDERLKRWKMYVANPHIRDATRHALTALRRARNDNDFRDLLWPNAR